MLFLTILLLFSFSPDIESKNIRYHMLNEHRAVIGKTRAFDGAVLFLPVLLDEKVRLYKKLRFIYENASGRTRKGTPLLNLAILL